MEVTFNTIRLISDGRQTYAEVDGKVLGRCVEEIKFTHKGGQDARLKVKLLPVTTDYVANNMGGETGVDFEKAWVDMKARAAGWNPWASGEGRKPDPRRTKGLQFRDAWFHLLNGKKIRRTYWAGYWEWKNNTIMIHTREGAVFNIFETDNPAFTFTNIAASDWEVVGE